MKPTIAALLMLMFCPPPLSGGGKSEPPQNPIEESRDYLSAIPLNPGGPPEYDEKVQGYFDFYRIDIPQTVHHFGAAMIRDSRIAAHLYIPEEAEKTIYLIHGYLLHSASYHYLIRRLVEEGYALVALDLPGHGLSSGLPGGIGEFRDYAIILRDLIDRLDPHLPEPHGIIGLSMGSAVIIELCRSVGSPFARHVLGAPLIRSDKWDLARFGYSFLGGLVKQVPSWNRDTTSNGEAKKFVQEIDPLKVRQVPLSWVGALYRWHDELHRNPLPIPGDFLVLQGDKDVVVDWRYNLSFLMEWLEGGDIRVIPGGKHELYLEAEELRNDIFRIILAYLGE